MRTPDWQTINGPINTNVRYGIGSYACLNCTNKFGDLQRTRTQADKITRIYWCIPSIKQRTRGNCIAQHPLKPHPRARLVSLAVRIQQISNQHQSTSSRRRRHCQHSVNVLLLRASGGARDAPASTCVHTKTLFVQIARKYLSVLSDARSKNMLLYTYLWSRRGFLDFNIQIVQSNGICTGLVVSSTANCKPHVNGDANCPLENLRIISGDNLEHISFRIISGDNLKAYDELLRKILAWLYRL